MNSTTPTEAAEATRGRAGANVRPAVRPTRRHLPSYLVVSDLVVLLAALPLCVWGARIIFSASAPPLADRLWLLAVLPLALPFLLAYRLYDNDRRRITVSSLGELFATFHAVSLFAFLLLFALVGFNATDTGLAPRELFLFWLIALAGIPLARSAVRRYALRFVNAPQRTLIVGAGHVGQSVARKLTRRPDLNLEVVGFLDSAPHPIAKDLNGLTVLGGETEIARIALESRAERIILSFSRTSHEDLLEILRQSGLDRLYVSVVPRFFEIMASNVEVDDIAGIPVLDLNPARLSRIARLTKRGTDLVLTSLAIPFLLPLFVITAIAIKLDSRGPVLFRQPRMGRYGRVFRIFKFRTMEPEAESRRAELLHLNEVSGPLFKLRADPRVTRVGRFLRKTSLDELPQLLNVLGGDMSLVGPRPFVTYEAAEIQGWARRRLDLTPGITGAWQVMGRNDMPFEEMVKLDYLYVTNWSLAWDLRLLLQTIPSVLRRKGAY